MKSAITQRHFDLSSSLIGLIDGSFVMGNLLFLAVVSHFGAKLHRPRLIAMGCFLMAVGSFLTGLPQIFMGRSGPTEERGGGGRSPSSHSLESIQVNKSFSSSSVWPVPVPPTGAPSKRGKKKKGRRGVKALKVQLDQGCADNNGPIDLMEEVRDIEAHLKEEAWKVVHEVKAMGRRSLGSDMSMGEIATSSLGSLSGYEHPSGAP
ncbi:solute carrier organic anion transporter family member 1B3-like [Oncorhynchus nerka]|uniref:solute carrier organic anion transporter family member 1B3-like n=1 Tax=Oncorhynchus nerka TaxID=8023 RepID=UPI0031B7FBCB